MYVPVTVPKKTKSRMVLIEKEIWTLDVFMLKALDRDQIHDS
jgi:hypothetical protein